LAATLSYTLRSAGKLTLLYGGFTGVVATLVFLYLSASTLIYGAEINAVLREKSTAPEDAALPDAAAAAEGPEAAASSAPSGASPSPR
jgi:membrane protein